MYRGIGHGHSQQLILNQKQMNNILRVIIAIVAGVFAGGIANMSLIMISGSIIPPPEGAITTTMEGLQASLHLFEPRHFIMPFLAHALGAVVGAVVVSLIVRKHKMKFAIGIGAWFMIGGIVNILILPSPLWFTVVDLGLAYIPMAIIGGKLGVKWSAKNQ